MGIFLYDGGKSSVYNELLFIQWCSNRLFITSYFFKKKDSHRFFKRVINAYLFVKAYKLELPFSFWKQTFAFGPQQVQATSTNKKDTCSQFYNLLLPNTSTQQYTVQYIRCCVAKPDHVSGSGNCCYSKIFKTNSIILSYKGC